MALAYPFAVAEMTESAPPPVVVPSTAAVAAVVTVGPLTLLPKLFASDIDMKDKGFVTREETLEEESEVDFSFGKGGSGGGVDRGNDEDDDDGEEEDEKVLRVVVVVEEPARVDELNDCRGLAMGILELNEDGASTGFVAERFLVGESGRDTDEGVGD